MKPRYEVVDGSGSTAGVFETYSDAVLWLTFYARPGDAVYDTETEEILAEVGV